MGGKKGFVSYNFQIFMCINPEETEWLSITGTKRRFGTKSASAVYTFLRPPVPPLSFCIQHTSSSITADHHHFQSHEGHGKIKEMVCMHECVCVSGCVLVLVCESTSMLQ